MARQRQFVSDASHELRTPLTAIRGQAEVLGRTADPDAERREGDNREDLAAGDAHGSPGRRHAAHGANRRGRAGAPRRHRPVAAGRGGDQQGWATDEPGEGPTSRRSRRAALRGDHDQLLRALANVVQNAVEHTPADGQVRVSASARRGLLRVLVDDDGPGIPAAERELVFERFHEATPPETAVPGAAGSGCAIAHAIVDGPWRTNLGGRVAPGWCAHRAGAARLRAGKPEPRALSRAGGPSRGSRAP